MQQVSRGTRATLPTAYTVKPAKCLLILKMKIYVIRSSFVFKTGGVCLSTYVCCEAVTEPHLSSQARRLFAAPISSTTEVRKSLGGLREVLPSYAGLFLRSAVAMCRLLVAALILTTRLFKLSVSTP